MYLFIILLCVVNLQPHITRSLSGSFTTRQISISSEMLPNPFTFSGIKENLPILPTDATSVLTIHTPSRLISLIIAFTAALCGPGEKTQTSFTTKRLVSRLFKSIPSSLQWIKDINLPFIPFSLRICTFLNM